MSLRFCYTGLDLARFDDDAGAHSVVACLIDQDEGAAVAVVGVAVGDDDRAGPQCDFTDVVEYQFDWLVEFLERLRVQAGMQPLHRGAHGSGALLERESVTGAQRGIAEPAHRGVEFTRQHRQRGILFAADEHIATANVDVVCQFDRNRQWGNTYRTIVIEGINQGDLRAGTRGQAETVSPTLQCPGRESAGVAAPLLGGRTGHPLHRKTQLVRSRVAVPRAPRLPDTPEGWDRRTTRCCPTGARRCRRASRRAGSP